MLCDVISMMITQPSTVTTNQRPRYINVVIKLTNNEQVDKTTR